VALGVNDKALLTLTGAIGRHDANGEHDVAGRLAGLSLGSTPVGADHSAAVEAILSQHVALGGEPTHAGGDVSEPEQQSPHSSDVAGDDVHGGGGGGDAREIPFVDPVDWDAPLLRRADNSGGDTEGEESNGAAIRASAAAASMTMVLDPGELRRVCASAELGLRFAEAAEDAGHADAARTALGVLVRFANVLPPLLLEELVASMGRCRMTESTRNLAAAAALARPGSALQAPGVAALLAALTGGGQGDTVQTTLLSSGLAPLSAVFSAVWGKGNRNVALDKWKAQLGRRASDDVHHVAIAPPLG